jgi:hypothetical protein
MAFTVDDGGTAIDTLSIHLAPADNRVLVEVADTGVLNWQRLRGTISPARFAGLVAAVRAVLAAPPDAGGGHDCGTHGCWIEEATVELPLVSGTLAATARRTQGFSSQRLLDAVDDLLQELARDPEAEAMSWEALRARKRRRRLVAAALALAVAAVALIAVVVRW